MSAESPVAASLKLGRYILERRIASGGMADVYLARQVGAFGFAKNVAVKVLKHDASGDPEQVRMFLREAMVAAEFKHPNLVQVYEVGEEGGRLYLAMELVRGLSLATVMQNLAGRRRSIPIPLAARIARDALEGMQHAHEAVNADGQPLRLVHRDLSPQNVLVDVNGVVKVVDFGIARAETRAGRTQGAQIKGKFGYMAPEQWNAAADIDARADLFSLAVVLYETSTGSRRLFRGQSAPELYRAIVHDTVPPPSRHVPEYPANLADVVMRGLARAPDERWTTAAQMRDALDVVMADNRWTVTPEDLARLVALALDGQSIEDRWERIASGQLVENPDDDVALAAMAAMSSSRPASLRPPAAVSGPWPAITPGDGLPASAATSSATVSARPSALGLAEPPAPSGLRPQQDPPPAPAPSPLPSPAVSTVSTAPDVDRPSRVPEAARLSVRTAAALAGWLMALAMGVSWYRARERLDASRHTLPVAVRNEPAPVVVTAATLLADPSLHEGVALPWATALREGATSATLAVDHGDALARLLRGEGTLALRAGFAGEREVTAARALGIELRSPASEHVTGYDHAVVIVHPSNPLPSLSTSELAALFNGRARSFHPLHGLRGDVHPITSGAGAPTRAFLDDAVLPLAAPFAPRVVLSTAPVVPDEAAAVAAVARDPGAIALVRLAWVTGPVRVVPMRRDGSREAVTPTRDTIRNGTYPLVRPVVLYTRGQPFGAERAALDFALGPQGQTLLERAGYVSR